MEHTDEQRRVVDHAGGLLRVGGGPGTGRTTALAARYLALVGEGGHRPSAVLVVNRNRPAAARFLDAVLPHLRGAFDALPVTTWFGVAFDLVGRDRDGPVRLLSTSEQRGVVGRLLARESPADWPVFGRYLGRDAFADEVAAALREDPSAEEGGGATGEGGDELARFADRYRAVLAERGQVDAAGLLATAAGVARPGRYDHVLVDDHDEASPACARLLAAVAGPGAGLTVVAESAAGWPADEVVLTRRFRQPAPPLLVTCPHPSTEAEAVAGELLAARAEGVAWSQMAVLVRHSPLRGRAVARALSRHGIPVAPGPGLGTGMGDPAVAAIIDLLRWSAGDEEVVDRLLVSPLSGLGPDGLQALRDEVAAAASDGHATPAELAFTVWERGLGHLVGGRYGDDASLDAVVAFVDGLAHHADHARSGQSVDGLLAELGDDGLEPDPWRVSHAAADPEAVTVASIAAAAGREWHTVVVAGCVEGELPRIRGRAPLFDRSPRSPAERRRDSLAEERRLFRTACSRATARTVAIAAPAPGVLLSRFVEGWDRAEARPPPRSGPPPVARQETTGDQAVFPGGALVLSASQLSTYDDCPLRYAYQYGLRVRDEAGAPAALGSLVHEVLAEFTAPDGPDGPAGAPPRSRQGLLALAAERWRDDVARYRPQVEECRRDYFSMLEAWWAAEGDGPQAPEVLAVERRFEIEVAGIRLVGAIDRVDRAADGEGIRIVDYKTGRNEPRPDALTDDLQLAVYHLAATRDPDLAALGPPRQLQLLYLRTMHRFEQPILEGHAEATEARIHAAAAAIRAERFEPALDAPCRTCPFTRLCPLQPDGREVGAA